MEDIVRFFEGYELMGNPATMVREARTIHLLPTPYTLYYLCVDDVNMGGQRGRAL